MSCTKQDRSFYEVKNNVFRSTIRRSCFSRNNSLFWSGMGSLDLGWKIRFKVNVVFPLGFSIFRKVDSRKKRNIFFSWYCTFLYQVYLFLLYFIVLQYNCHYQHCIIHNIQKISLIIFVHVTSSSFSSIV